MDDSLACLLPEGSSPQNPTWSDRALQRKHRSPEQDYHRLRSLPGGSVRRCPVCVPRIARNGSSRHSRQSRAAILARPAVTESRVLTQPGPKPHRRLVPGKTVVMQPWLWHNTDSSCCYLICAGAPACLTEGHNRLADGVRQLDLFFPFGVGDDGLQVLWEDGERVFCRGWRREA